MIKRLWNSVQDLAAFTVFHPQYFLKIAQRAAVAEVRRRASGNFLDVGCGRQWYRPILEPLFKRYYAMEKPDNVRLYESRFPREILADASEIPLPESSVNVVMMAEVLEFLEEPPAAIKEIRRVLRPKGELIIFTVDNYPSHGQPGNFRHYQSSGLRRLLNDSGFRVTSLKAVGNFWETRAIYTNIFLMKRTKELIFKRQMTLVGLAIFALVWPLMIFNNLAGIIFGRRRGTEEFALGHIVVARSMK